MARSCRAEWLRTRPGESYMKHRTARSHTQTGNLRRHARGLVGSIRVGPEPPDRLRLARFEVHARGARWAAAHRVPASSANHMEQGAGTGRSRERHYWFQHEPCWYVRKKNAPWFGKPGENSTIWDSPSPKFIMGGSDEEKLDHPTQKPVALMRRPILNQHQAWRTGLPDPFLGSGHDARRI